MNNIKRKKLKLKKLIEQNKLLKTKIKLLKKYYDRLDDDDDDDDPDDDPFNTNVY